MPQIDQIASIYASQLFWLVVVFALIYFGIGKAMLPKIQRTVDDRDAKIAGDLAAAKAAREAADQADDAYQSGLAASRNEAQAAAAAAKARAIAASEVRIKAADVEIAHRVAHAEAALASARIAAIGKIELVAIEATQDIVERVAGLSVDKGQAAAAVADVMARA
jgi:F-type H+-transporting ATPase subunit b